MSSLETVHDPPQIKIITLVTLMLSKQGKAQLIHKEGRDKEDLIHRVEAIKSVEKVLPILSQEGHRRIIIPMKIE